MHHPTGHSLAAHRSIVTSRRVLGTVLSVAAVVAATERFYRRYLRNWVLTWGATAEEVAGRLPGDEFLEPADIVATRAIEIHAPPSAIWPWLVQMGPGRAGAYTYDWIENLFGLDMHSADRIVPEWQQPRGGRRASQPEGRPGYAGGDPRARARLVEPLRGRRLGLDLRARARDTARPV